MVDSGGATATTNTVGSSGLPAYVVIFDPDGSVTGGGWILSPPGALTGDGTAEGKANFGFVSEYKKGAHVPTGQTEFQFKAGDLNLHSAEYDWLVVAGARAQYKGAGTVNGVTGYRFMLTAIDGDQLGGTQPDRFRIKIWDIETDEMVYDNQVGTDDNSDLSSNGTLVQGGNIVVHKK